MRKLIIGLSAVGFVVLLFVIYALMMDAKPIEAPNETAAVNLNNSPSDHNIQQADDTGVRVADVARYVILDPETREVSRVFGFEKLLSPGMDTSHRQVKKPYMIFYDPDYECRIDADTGIFQMETTGAGSAPKDAQLSGNVIIHVTPKASSEGDEIVIEMDDVVFSSERSEFATDRRVDIKSNQMELKGTGLVVLFDPDNGNIDYLRIRDLDQIRIQGLVNSESPDKTKAGVVESPTNTASVASKPKTENNVAAVPSKETKSNNKDNVKESLRYYQCLLEDNVKIEYGNEIIVSGAEQVNIQNILFDENASDSKSSEQPKSKPKQAKRSNEALAENKQPVNNKSAGEKSQAVLDAEPSSEVIVTCDGGIILKPMHDQNTEKEPAFQSMLLNEMMPMPLRTASVNSGNRYTEVIASANFIGEQNVVTKSKPLKVGDDSDVLKSGSGLSDAPPAKFEARKIDYDLLTGSGLAHGPVRFTFYQSSDPNSPVPETWIPITVTADENAQFIADSSQTIKQVIFNGNVMTTRETQTPDFVQFDKLHSEKLIVDLDEVQEGKDDLSRLTVTEDRVYVDSQRIKGDRELSRVRLYSKEIYYDEVHDVIVAKGPGEIRLSNSPVSDTETDKSMKDSGTDSNQPCYVYIEGFEEIQWDLAGQKIVADGQQNQLSLSYVPLVDGKPEKFIFVNAIRFDLSFDTDSTGKSVIKRVFTDKPIHYREKDRNNDKILHEITGGNLDYNTGEREGWITISGTPAVPCRVDNVPMEKVRVNPVTGEIDTSISKRPGFWLFR